MRCWIPAFADLLAGSLFYYGDREGREWQLEMVADTILFQPGNYR